MQYTFVKTCDFAFNAEETIALGTLVTRLLLEHSKDNFPLSMEELELVERISEAYVDNGI